MYGPAPMGSLLALREVVRRRDLPFTSCHSVEQLDPGVVFVVDLEGERVHDVDRVHVLQVIERRVRLVVEQAGLHRLSR